MLKKSFIARTRRLLSSPETTAYLLRAMTLNTWMRRRRYKSNSGKANAPQNVVIFPTSRCNLKCSSCNIGLSHTDKNFAHPFSKKEISIDQWFAVVDKVAPFRPMILITGGEPFLYPKISELIEYLRKKKLYCSVTTNATLLNEEHIRRLVDAGVYMVTVSFDGLGEVHDRIRGVKETFDKAMTNLTKLIDYRRKKGKEFPIIHINSVMSRFNQHQLEKMTDFFASYDIDSLNLSHIWFYTKEMVATQNKLCRDGQFTITQTLGGEFGLDACADRDLEDLWTRISSIKKKYRDMKISFLPNLKTFEEMETYYLRPAAFIKPYDKCYAPWTSTEIYANGDIEFASSCFHIKVGNICEQGFESIWNGESFSHIRAELKKRGAFPICSRCCYIFQPL